MKSLRVLVIRNAYQQDAGGAEQYALNLCIALKNEGHRPILITKVKNILDKASLYSITAIRGKWHESQRWDRVYYIRYPVYVLWYIFIILRYQVDIVHAQSRDDFVFATRAASILRRRVIWTDHADLKYVLDNVNHYNPRMRGWVINAAKKASAITVASHNEKIEIEAVASDMLNLSVVHNGVFVPNDVQPVDKTNKLVVGTNARLVATKGIGELIEGFAKLGRKDIDLWLLGGVSGNLQTYQETSNSLGVSKQVVFWDYVPNPNNVVAAMDIFIHASYHEAFSLALIEAAMLARPIIATNVGGTPEIIDEKCGLLIEPKNSQAIAEAIDRLLGDRAKRASLGKAAKIKALSEFNFEIIVKDKILPLYYS